MNSRHKFEFLGWVAAIIVSPCYFTGAAPALSSSAVPQSAVSIKKEDSLPLSLSMSLFRMPALPPPLPESSNDVPAHVYVMPCNRVSEEKTEEAPGNPLPLTLASATPLAALDNGENLPSAGQGESESGADSRESLFGEPGPVKVKKPSQPAWKQLVTGWKGFSQLEIADTYASPEHLSKAKLRTELSRTGQFNEYLRWKISGRFDYDAAYDLSDFYPGAVRRDQRQQFFIRENYLDISAGNFDFRLGRQHVIWGEMVGLFFADVVSAKDMREFVLPSFDIIRIPQWALRAEYSKNDLHAEVLWIPVPTLDESGKPGSDFYPGPLRGVANYLPEDRSGRNVAHSNYGLRLSQLKNGWDVSAFYYHSLDASPTFYRVSAFTEPPVFQPRHDRIDQFGATLAKDFGFIVLKGETVYTDGRQFNTVRPTAINGLIRQNTLDYVLGVDVSLPAEARLNLQFFQRVYFNHDPDIIPRRLESGASILLAGKVWQKMEAQALLIHSLNRSDWMLRPRLSWNFQRNWRWALGADIFGGPPSGLFGRFDQSDRVYTELRYSF